MQVDKFGSELPSITGPGTAHFAIIPSDSEDMPILPRVIYCHEAGTIVVADKHGVTLPYTMEVGDRLDFRGVRVLSTGTVGTYYGWE